MTTQTRIPPTLRVGIVDLLTNSTHPETDEQILERMKKDSWLIICETAPSAADGAPRHTFRTPAVHCGNAPPPEIGITPVGIHLRRHGGSDVRFTPDLPTEDTDAYDYAGWLPLTVIRHPDRSGPHQAWATGDAWIAPPNPDDATIRASGVQRYGLTAQACLAETVARRHACWWSDPPPAA